MKYVLGVAATMLLAGPVLAQDSTLPPGFEIRTQAVSCSDYERISDLLTAEGLEQRILFSASGRIVDVTKNENGEEEVIVIPGVYMGWTNQDTGIATMTFTDRNGRTCIQSTMSKFSPQTGD